MKQGAHGDGRVRMRAARANACGAGSRTRNRTLRETGPCAARDPARNGRVGPYCSLVSGESHAARDPARNRRGEARAKQGAREGVVQMCAKRVKGPEMRTRVATGAGG